MTWRKALDWLAGVAGILAVSFITWLVATVLSHAEAVAEIRNQQTNDADRIREIRDDVRWMRENWNSKP